MTSPTGRRSPITPMLAVAIMLLLPAPELATARPFAGGDFSLEWHTVDGGGGTSSAGDATVSGTIGQPDAGVMTGGSFTLAGGFWQVGGDAVPCPGDIDGTGAVDFDDLLRVLGAWGPCPDCPEDLTGDDVVGFADLLIVLGGWGPCV